MLHVPESIIEVVVVLNTNPFVFLSNLFCRHACFANLKKYLSDKPDIGFMKYKNPISQLGSLKSILYIIKDAVFSTYKKNSVHISLDTDGSYFQTMIGWWKYRSNMKWWILNFKMMFQKTHRQCMRFSLSKDANHCPSLNRSHPWTNYNYIGKSCKTQSNELIQNLFIFS